MTPQTTDQIEEIKSPAEFAAWEVVLSKLEVGVTVLSPDLTIVYINDTYRRIVNIPESVAPGNSAYELYHFMASRGDYGEGDPDQLAKERLKAISSGIWSDAIHEMSNGRTNKIRREVIDGGFIVTTVTDITEIKTRETEVSEKETLMVSVLEATNQGILIVDNNSCGTVELFNTAYCNMFGEINEPYGERKSYYDYIRKAWKDGRFATKGIEDLDDEEFLSGTMDFVEKACADGVEIKLSDGRYVKFHGRDIENNRKIFTFTDITESKLREYEIIEAQKASDASLTDFDAAINNMDVGLVLLDANLDTLVINNAFHKLWNTSAENFLEGCNFRALMDINKNNGIYDVKEADWEDYVQMRLAELRAGEIEPREFERADGKTLVYSCIPLSMGQRLVRYTDITGFKEREAELEKAQFLAESADRSKSEFLANMSHEIRTPMNGVMGMAELLGRTELTSKQKMFTDVILNSSTALLTIINDILDFSKIEAGKLELDPSPFNLGEAIEDVATLVSSGVNEKNLELIVRIQPGLQDNLVGDAGRFRQILTNLLGNAVKFTEIGHVLVDVSGTENDGIVSLKCAVKDTGIGIPEDQIDNVFEKFSQVDGTSTRRHEGTGLGLAITTRLVSLMGGEVGCSSVLGEGSTFWFTADLPIDNNAKPKNTLPVDITGAKMLAIDDNPVNRSILLEQFEAWRLNGKAAESGLEGIAMLRQAQHEGRPFEIIVLDYHMPDMNGVDVAKVIRSDENIKDTAIIMLTSVDNISETAEFKILGINGHLTKPARASQLLEEIIDVKRSSEIQPDKASPEVGLSLADHSDDHVPTQRFQTGHKVETTQSLDIEDKPAPSSVAIENSAELDDKNNSAVGDYILVVEDNEVNQMVFSQILEYQNLNFRIVGNGKLAVEEVHKSRPKLVLMDVSMPVMNGIDATREIRQQFGKSATDQYSPIIIGVTAHALKDDRENCLAAGMDDYMTKPISPDMLLEKIKHWLPELDKLEKKAG